ncbi:hypothetical protein F7Q99_25645 [Streptomyces kaniharaensis]|uniref:Uncharacterized protein n=1 Tax=Streptomyces kaniharaensis TaxID=212423 RepID=A0A6N7L184_9ACTN|nr:hypothetical protein [Streptomyces kaniharaensis]MQS15563.1 hypothetical protein [Streptomyces kaniharaensis]
MDESEQTLRRLSRAIGPVPADLTAKVKHLIQQATTTESAQGAGAGSDEETLSGAPDSGDQRGAGRAESRRPARRRRS